MAAGSSGEFALALAVGEWQFEVNSFSVLSGEAQNIYNMY
jgi:hypothetical protein